MYIGPWQEFNLNKERTLNSESEKNKVIHQNLVSILENSLDPVAAKQAIQAINPYLQDVSESSLCKPIQHTVISRNEHASHGKNSRFPNVSQSRNPHRGRSYRHINRSRGVGGGEGGGRRRNQRERQALPLILSARNNYHYDSDNNGPPSHRSTMSSSSEPIKGTAFTPEEKVKPPKPLETLHTEENHRYAGYDTSNVLDILKIERNAIKNANKIQSNQSDFSSFWKWKSQGKPVPASFTAHNNNLKKNNKKNNNKESTNNNDVAQEMSKMDRMQKMKEIYAQNRNPSLDLNLDFAQNGSSESKHSSSKHQQQHFQLSPIRSPRSRPHDNSNHHSFSKPSTPVVKEQDLTDTDMAVVSKYFNRNRHKNVIDTSNPSSNVASPGPSRRTSQEQPPSLTLPPPSPPSYERHHQLHPQAHQHLTSSPHRSKDSPNSRTNLNSFHPTRDILSRGDGDSVLGSPLPRGDLSASGRMREGDGGLLEWCTNLNLDDIESMY